ncbi:site-2 protease family protein [Gracilibacillus sp. S3-1-1]|uniref:Site-2 protease family protein n=1 Tax=Gracilibacillus pellucidus TaxID=3095368 RepID=A0ACC6M717_9BACI|nr:site-2 protease family protein [Gracilibacillus sp. S3-1-1]MDX8046557.1 site-2 protease family protein [Gracilibacillus sp. S3-1-1]
MNNLKLPPIHFHPIFFFFLFVAVITGMFIEFLIIFLIVLIHELGHYMCARLFKWRIRRIFLWVFGGVMETEEYGSRSIREEFFVTIAGPCQHILIYLVIYILGVLHVLPESILLIAYQYNTFILIGNLLPIWPLDGGKLVQLSLDTFFSFQTAHKLMIGISFFTIVFLSIYLYDKGILSLSMVLLMIFLMWENRLEWKQRYMRWWQFLWSRHSYTSKQRKYMELEVPSTVRLVELFRKFKRDTYYWIKVYDQFGTYYWLSEQDCLTNFFEEKDIQASLEQLLTRERGKKEKYEKITLLYK